MVPHWERESYGSVLGLAGVSPSASESGATASFGASVLGAAGEGTAGGEGGGVTTWKPLVAQTPPQSPGNSRPGKRVSVLGLPPGAPEVSTAPSDDGAASSGGEGDGGGAKAAPQMRTRARRRGAVGAAEEAAARTANALDRMEKEKSQSMKRRSETRRGTAMTQQVADFAGQAARANAASGGVVRASNPDFRARREQLLLWRDTMQDAQRHMASTPSAPGSLFALAGL